MKKYHVVISKVAGKELRNLPKDVIGKVYLKMMQLADDPRPAGCKKLEGLTNAIWRIRVGDYRILYSIDDEICIVDIQQIGHRRNFINNHNHICIRRFQVETYQPY